MNKELRELLIQHAKNDRPVTYGTVLNLLGLEGSEGERAYMSQELGEISREEAASGRPMLSAMAMFKDFQETGGEFFRIAEELGYDVGSDKEAFAKLMRDENHAFWIKPENEPLVANSNLVIATPQGDTFTDETTPLFFTQDDLDFYIDWAGEVYKKDEPDHQDAHERLVDSFGDKIAYWADEICKRIPGLETWHPRTWQKMAWIGEDGSKTPVSTFRHYMWARIYRQEAVNKGIYFTVQIDGDESALIYKLDYAFEKNSTLTPDQQAMASQLIPDDIKWIPVPYEMLPEYNWEKLIGETVSFINDNIHTYDEILRSIANGEIIVTDLENRLIKRPIPSNGVTKLPERNRSYKGYDTDWQKKNQEQSNLGKMGEDLVIFDEQQYLKRQNRPDLAEKVRRALPGEGYDVRSFYLDADGDESDKFIEVKTTKSANDASFPISITEVDFSADHPKEFVLSRIFHFDEKKNTGECHEYPGPIADHFLLESTNYLAQRREKINTNENL